MDDTIPKTVTELENWMKAHCYNFESYSITGNSIYEGFGIDKSGTIFIWYYTGFCSDLSKTVLLKKELDTMNIKYLYDEIPYYGNRKPIYRVFVLGCDIKKTIHLKEKYCTE